MKRFLSLAVCLLLLAAVIGTVPAAAEGSDLSRMSDDEIVALLRDVNSEIARRGIAKTATLAKGAYIAGEDIPCGRYMYTCLAKGDDWGNVTVYSERGAGKQLMWHVVAAPEKGEEPETIYITLNEGDELKSGVPFSLTIMPAVTFR